jgi:hypothetical protein
MSENLVSLLQIRSAVHAGLALMSPETAGYLTLAIGHTLLSQPTGIDEEKLMLSIEGDVVSYGTHRASVQGTESSLRHLLSAMLASVSNPTPALLAVACSSTSAGLSGLIQELEQALIPINHSAARRALARLARESLRAVELIEGDSLPAVSPLGQALVETQEQLPESDATNFAVIEADGDSSHPVPVAWEGTPSLSEPSDQLLTIPLPSQEESQPPPNEYTLSPVQAIAEDDQTEVQAPVFEPSRSAPVARVVNGNHHPSTLPATNLVPANLVPAHFSSLQAAMRGSVPVPDQELDQLIQRFETTMQRDELQATRELRRMVGITPTPALSNAHGGALAVPGILFAVPGDDDRKRDPLQELGSSARQPTRGESQRTLSLGILFVMFLMLTSAILFVWVKHPGFFAGHGWLALPNSK